MKNRSAFTLVEVLIAVALLSIVLMALYSALDMQKAANKHLLGYLDKAIDGDKAIMTLYKDILYSDGNLSIKKGEFDQLCLYNTSNTLYGLSKAQVCWIVAKDENSLMRVEGNGYTLPARLEDKTEVDIVMKHLVLFDITRTKSQMLVALQTANEVPYTFLVQGIKQPPKPKKKAINTANTNSVVK